MVEGFVNIHGVINHISVVEKLNLRLQNIFLRIQPSLLQELEQWEHQMPVQIRRYPRRQVILRRHCLRLLSDAVAAAAVATRRLILELKLGTRVSAVIWNSNKKIY